MKVDSDWTHSQIVARGSDDLIFEGIDVGHRGPRSPGPRSTNKRQKSASGRSSQFLFQPRLPL